MQGQEVLGGSGRKGDQVSIKVKVYGSDGRKAEHVVNAPYPAMVQFPHPDDTWFGAPIESVRVCTFRLVQPAASYWPSPPYYARVR